jgi:hypothetical protein
MLKNEQTELIIRDLQEVLGSIDEYLKAQEVMKRGFLSSLSEKLQKLNVTLENLTEKENIKKEEVKK